MRTKALLCAAALAATAATSMAQSNVYSLNVVGYINVTYTNRFQMVANQLDLDGTGTNNTLQTVFGTNVPNFTSVYTYTPGSGYANPATLIAGVWQAGTAANTTLVNHGLDIGRGVWLQIPVASPTPASFTEVGNVFQGSKATPLSVGFNMVSLAPPLSEAIQTAGGVPAGTFDTVYRFIQPAGYTGHTHTKLAASWSPSEPVPAVGEAFWYQRAAANGATTWTQNFTVP